MLQFRWWSTPRWECPHRVENAEIGGENWSVIAMVRERPLRTACGGWLPRHEGGTRGTQTV